MTRGKVLVVGGGIAGLSVAWGLVRRGFAVELFEQGALPHPKSSSYDEHRIIRHAYGDMEGYAYLMPDAFRLWDELWAEIGVRHFDPMPVIYLMRGESDWYDTTKRSLARMNIACTDLSNHEALSRYPMINPAGLTRVVQTEGAGILYPIRILTDLVKLLAHRGVVLHPNTPVHAVDPDAGTLRTPPAPSTPMPSSSPPAPGSTACSPPPPASRSPPARPSCSSPHPKHSPRHGNPPQS